MTVQDNAAGGHRNQTGDGVQHRGLAGTIGTDEGCDRIRADGEISLGQGMRLSNREEKKIVLVLTTREEFPGRPNLCSIYAVTWLFSAKEGSLKYFLSTETGIVDATGLDQAAETILGRTDKLATTYGYLF